MARNSLLCADVPLRNYSLTHSLGSTAHVVEALEGRMYRVSRPLHPNGAGPQRSQFLGFFSTHTNNL